MTAKTASAAKKSAKSAAPKAEAPSLLGENTVFTLTLPKDQVAAAWQSALSRAQQAIKIDGFRQGKAPLKLVEERVDRSKLIELALEKVLPAAYSAHIQERQLLPMTEPEVKPLSLAPDEDWSFEVTIAQAPAIDLGKYREVVTKLKQQHELWQKKPEDATADKSDKNNEESVKNGEPTLRQQQVSALLQAILAEVVVQVPELLVRREAEHQLSRFMEQLERFQIPLEKYLENVEKTREEFQQEHVATAFANLQVDLLLGAVVRDARIEVGESEVAALLAARHAGHDHGADHEYDPQEVRLVQSLLLKQKALDFLLEL